MTDYLKDMGAVFLTAERLRFEAGCEAEVPLDVETLLPRLYPAVCVRISGLSVQALRHWFQRQDLPTPPTLVTCRDRRLRGGVIASRGYGLLFADQDDTPEEIRFTFAHEAAHFLHDHLYPRQDLLRRFGPRIQPVLDGLRPPTRYERIDALLAHADLALHTHLLERDDYSKSDVDSNQCDDARNSSLGYDIDSDLERIESEADVFACEILAPHAALCACFPAIALNEEAVTKVHRVLVSDFGLPDTPAEDYARDWVAEYGQPDSLLDRLRLL